MQSITYVGPFDAVDIVTGLTDFNEPMWLTVTRGETVDVDDTIAGRPPSAEYLDAHAAIADAHPVAVAVATSDEDRAAAQRRLADADAQRRAADPGEGLLAQPTNWQPAAPASPPPPAAKPGKTPPAAEPAPVSAEEGETK